MRVAILGATRGMGRSLARLMAERGDTLVLLGRHPEDLEKSARDLEIRSPQAPTPSRGSPQAPTPSRGSPQAPTPSRGAGRGAVMTAVCDLERPETFAPALVAARAALGGLDIVVVTAGLFASQDALEGDAELALRLLVVDFAHTVAFCEEVRRMLLAGGGGTLCVFSSVAGERGRKPVVLYGAAKAGLTRYLEGLDHKFRAQGLKVVCVKPGFVKTSMTDGLTPPPFAGEPDDVARRVLKGIDRGEPVVYAPAMWRWVMLVIRNLPRFVMRRIQF